MASTINADTSDGVVVTSDTSGEIKLQSAGADIATVSSTGIAMASGKTITGGGRILQVLQTVKTDIFTTTSTSFVDVTGFTASITPSSATSKILVTATTSISQSSTAGLVVFNLLRGSTNLSQPDTTPTFNGTMAAYQQTASAITPATINFLDSPSTTSATTYKIQLRVHAGTCLLNGRNTNDGAFTSTLTLMEVAG